MLPGEATVLTSADSTCEPKDSTRFPVEFLNKLTPAGLPPHHLYIKKGMVLMLLRNLSPEHGLCNGVMVHTIHSPLFHYMYVIVIINLVSL